MRGDVAPLPPLAVYLKVAFARGGVAPVRGEIAKLVGIAVKIALAGSGLWHAGVLCRAAGLLGAAERIRIAEARLGHARVLANVAPLPSLAVRILSAFPHKVGAFVRLRVAEFERVVAGGIRGAVPFPYGACALLQVAVLVVLAVLVRGAGRGSCAAGEEERDEYEQRGEEKDVFEFHILSLCRVRIKNKTNRGSQRSETAPVERE